MNPIHFGNYLRQLRQSQFLSIRELSRYSGVSNSYISQLENGNRGIPKPDILEKLAPHLDVKYEALMEKAGYIDLVKAELTGTISRLSGNDDLDIEKTLNAVIKYIETQETLNLSGLPMEHSDRLFLKEVIEMGLSYTKDKIKNKLEAKKPHK